MKIIIESIIAIFLIAYFSSIITLIGTGSPAAIPLVIMAGIIIYIITSEKPAKYY